MQRQPSNFMIPRVLALAALQGVFAVNLSAQAPVQADPASELTFDEVRTSSRKNPLDLFKLHTSPANAAAPQNHNPSPRSTASDSRAVATQLTVLAQPPATTPPQTPPPQTPPATSAPAVAGPRATDVPAIKEATQTDPLQTDGEVSAGGRQTGEASDQSADKNSIDELDALGKIEAADRQRDTLTPLQSRPLSTRILAVNVSMEDIGTGLLPEGSDRNKDLQPTFLPTGYERAAAYKVAQWQPSMICHYPLYFEDAMLERHGHVRFGCLQSLASGAKFFGTLPLMPYLYTLKPKHECQYALGHYRAGSCAPVLRDHLPWDRQAAVVEALTLSSFFWAAPL